MPSDHDPAEGISTRLSEPRPAPGARELFPDVFADLKSGAFLCFLFFVLEAV